MVNAAAARPSTAGYSRPPSVAKKPLGAWTLAATPIVVAAAAPAAGVASPRARARPAPASPTPARTALGFAGRKPMACMPWLVPSTPPPPNQPKSFWDPWAMSTPPRPTRNRVCAAAAASGLVVTWLITVLLGLSASLLARVGHDSTSQGRPGHEKKPE